MRQREDVLRLEPAVGRKPGVARAERVRLAGPGGAEHDEGAALMRDDLALALRETLERLRHVP